MILIHNEQTKLTANALDRFSTAFLAVGVLGQVFSLAPSQEHWLRLLSIIVWLFAAFALHLAARRFLRNLQQP